MFECCQREQPTGGMGRLFLTVLLAELLLPALAALDLGFGNDTDLTRFVTRPEIKVPLFDVKVHDTSKVTDGYWFVAPYANVRQEPAAHKYYQACQTGPLIYDNEGELIWSGACIVKNQNTCDFRAWQINGKFMLSGLLLHNPDEWMGHGFVMDSSYTFVHEVPVPPPIQHFNMHEFNLVDNGKHALHVVNKPLVVDISDTNSAYDTGWILDMGFREVDVVTGETTFSWWAHENMHVNVNESHVKKQHLLGPPPASWDYFHGNAVDKDDEGNYLFNGRHTDTVYKISGEDGAVLWRLGGSNSSFIHEDGFNFSRQHDARFVERKDDKEIISLLDNASDLSSQTSTHSSALIVELDQSANPPTARVLKQIVRPDGKLTKSRGNYQRLENGNAFICWSDNSYLTEHDSTGQLVMEAKFRSRRFTSYRGYKFNFTGSPSEPIALKAMVFGTNPQRASTVIYVSWNGATKVNSYQFFGTEGDNHIELGTEKKKGFETSFVADGFFKEVYVKALDHHGVVLGTSDIFQLERPENWAFDSQRSDSIDSITVETNEIDVADSDPQTFAPENSSTSFTMLLLLALTLLIMILGYRLYISWHHMRMYRREKQNGTTGSLAEHSFKLLKPTGEGVTDMGGLEIP